MAFGTVGDGDLVVSPRWTVQSAPISLRNSTTEKRGGGQARWPVPNEREHVRWPTGNGMIPLCGPVPEAAGRRSTGPTTRV